MSPNRCQLCPRAKQHAEDPVRRGFSVLSSASLEYWVARSSRAMTTEYVFALSRRVAQVTFALRKSEGAGNAGCALHRRSRVQFAQEDAHTSIQVQRKHSDIP